MGSWLRELQHQAIPAELPELVRHGLPTEKYPLWAHQEAALRAAWTEDGSPRNLVVASGTGSGKTECFYLPILADILREALGWPSPSGPEVTGSGMPGVNSGCTSGGTRRGPRPCAPSCFIR